MDIIKMFKDFPKGGTAEQQNAYIEACAEDIYGLSAEDRVAFLDSINPKESLTGKRMFPSDMTVQTVDDLLDPNKVITTMKFYIIKNKGTERTLSSEETKVTNLEAEVSELKNKRKTAKKKNGIIASIAAVMFAGVALSFVMTANNNASLRKELKTERDNNSVLLEERDDLRDKLLAGVENKDQYKDKTLAEIFDELGFKSEKETKAEVNEAYAFIVKVLEERGITLADIYDEKSGEYDVEKLGENLSGVLKYFQSGMNELGELEEKVSAVIEALNIPNVIDENGNAITYKTIEDYASLGDAIDDIVYYSSKYSDEQLVAIKLAIDNSFASAGLSFTVDNDFGGDVFKTIEALESVFAKSIKDDCKSLQDVKNTISNLVEEYDAFKEKYSALQGEYDKLDENYKKLEDEYQEKVDGGNLSGQGGVSETEKEGGEITPVVGEEKDEQGNNGQLDIDGGKVDGSGSGTGHDYDLDY